MRRALGFHGALAIGVLAAGMALAPPAAAAPAGDCIVQQSAQAALQRQLAIIDASKTNVSSFFNGPNSCVSSGLLSSFDLSQLIPDLAGLLQNGLTNLYRTVLDQAKQQVCRVVNGQIQDVVGRINSVRGQYQSTIGGNLAGLMGSSTIALPTGIPNFGNYALTVPTISQLAQPVAQPAVQAPVAVQAPPAPAVAMPTLPPATAYPWLQQ